MGRNDAKEQEEGSLMVKRWDIGSPTSTGTILCNDCSHTDHNGRHTQSKRRSAMRAAAPSQDEHAWAESTPGLIESPAKREREESGHWRAPVQPVGCCSHGQR